MRNGGRKASAKCGLDSRQGPGRIGGVSFAHPLRPNLSRKDCVGIEIEERFCEMAAKRCAQEVLDFTPRPAPPTAAEQKDP
jgi:hypothetical protein